MKALLLKDAYQLRAYCKSMLLVVGVFGVVSLFSQDNPFFFASVSYTHLTLPTNSRV